MKKYIRVVGILGIIQVILLTLVGLYFYRLGHNNQAKETAFPPAASQSR